MAEMIELIVLFWNGKQNEQKVCVRSGQTVKHIREALVIEDRPVRAYLTQNETLRANKVSFHLRYLSTGRILRDEYDFKRELRSAASSTAAAKPMCVYIEPEGGLPPDVCWEQTARLGFSTDAYLKHEASFRSSVGPNNCQSGDGEDAAATDGMEPWHTSVAKVCELIDNSLRAAISNHEINPTKEAKIRLYCMPSWFAVLDTGDGMNKQAIENMLELNR